MLVPYLKMRTSSLKYNPSEVGQNLFYGISMRRNYRKALPYLLEAAGLGYLHSQNLVEFTIGVP